MSTWSSDQNIEVPLHHSYANLQNLIQELIIQNTILRNLSTVTRYTTSSIKTMGNNELDQVDKNRI